MEAIHCKYLLDFKKPSGTSRGILTEKESHFIILKDKGRVGIGECGLLKGLSIDDTSTYENKLSEVCSQINMGLQPLLESTEKYPSIQFGLEQAFLSLHSDDPYILFPSDFTSSREPISINGLIWMGEESFMLEQLEEKTKAGFNCIKMKVGALDFDTELHFLESLRREYPAKQVELRLDANGAFKADEALEKLEVLSRFSVHSIEQPIEKGQWEQMAQLCRQSPIPIALDEELIGIFSKEDKEALLERIIPQYIILKPSLVGGFEGSGQWIDLANQMGIGWWITSALESNIGLNAIAQWTYSLGTEMYQGLGTGSLYTNNFDSPLIIEQGKLYYDASREWQENLIEDLCS